MENFQNEGAVVFHKKRNLIVKEFLFETVKLGFGDFTMENDTFRNHSKTNTVVETPQGHIVTAFNMGL